MHVLECEVVRGVQLIKMFLQISKALFSHIHLLNEVIENTCKEVFIPYREELDFKKDIFLSCHMPIIKILRKLFMHFPLGSLLLQNL